MNNKFINNKNAYDEVMLAHKDEAIKTLKEFSFNENANVDSNTIQAAAFCKIYAKETYKEFKQRCKVFNINMNHLEERINSLIRIIKQQQRKAKESIKSKDSSSFILRREANISKLQELLKQSKSDERDEEMITLINDSLELNKSGLPIANVPNYELIMHYDPVVNNCIGYDAFAYKLVPIRSDLPWKDKSMVKLSEWGELDDASLQNYINRTYGNLNNEKILRNVLTELSNENSFHPVRQYFEALPKWDGTPRAEKIFIKVLGVADDEYSRSITIHWLKAAVARIYYPGCKHDFCMVLKGKQGKGKSTILSKLGGTWFNDSIVDINGKEVLENIQGSWIIELGEMQATRRADNEAIKAFLSRKVDKFRLPYGRRTGEYPRQCVFAATTNSPEFLKDRTGGRRFWILVCDDEFDTFQALGEIDKNYIDQIWAEVFHIMKSQKPFDEKQLLPPPEILQKAQELQEEYTEGSGFEGMVMAFLDMLIPDNETWDNMDKNQRRKYASTDGRGCNIAEGYGDAFTSREIPAGTRKRNIVCATEIAYECFKMDNPNTNRGTIKEITEILDGLPNWISKGRTTCGIYGVQRKVYVRKGSYFYN